MDNTDLGPDDKRKVLVNLWRNLKVKIFQFHLLFFNLISPVRERSLIERLNTNCTAPQNTKNENRFKFIDIDRNPSEDFFANDRNDRRSTSIVLFRFFSLRRCSFVT